MKQIQSISDNIAAMSTEEITEIRAKLAYLDAKGVAQLNKLRNGKPHSCG